MKNKREEGWVVTMHDMSYSKEIKNKGKEAGLWFTTSIADAKIYPTEDFARMTLAEVTKGGAFVDTRGYETPTSAFGVRKLTAKDYKVIQERKAFKELKRKEVA